MKKKQFFVTAFLAFIPTFVFAAYGETYGFVVGGGPDCGINTIPKFIKATIELGVKVGIPIASIFIIWAGFKFLTAQGNEGELKKAKEGLLWSCVGFGVLLGAWLLSTALLGTLTSIMGGSAEDAVITPCGSEVSETQQTENVASNLNPKSNLANQNNTDAISPGLLEFLSAEGSTHTGLGALTGDAGKCESGQYGGSYVATDVMEDNNLSSTDPDLFTKGLAILQKDASLETTEQAYLFVRFGSGGGAFLHTSGGTSIATEYPPIYTIEKNIIDPSLTGVPSIHLMHTHPASLFKGKIPPSVKDLMSADIISNNDPKTEYYFEVADFGGVWKYSVPSGSQFHKAISRTRENMKTLLALPEIKSKVTINKCSPEPDLLKIFTDASSGKYGSFAKGLMKELDDDSNEAVNPFVFQDARFLQKETSLQYGTTDEQKRVIMKEREDLIRSLGVELIYAPK